MIIRTILFFVLMYFLIKFISRLFLPAANQRQRKGASFYYQVFKQYRQNQQRQQQKQHQQNSSKSRRSADRFQEIEEAEFEDITEEEKSARKSSD